MTDSGTGPAPAAVPCPSCGQPAVPGARYCPQCGRAVGNGKPAGFPGGLGGLIPWVLGVALVLVLLALLWRQPEVPGAPGAAMAAVPGAPASPPDISSLSPRERFDRLYDRIIAAAQAGDQETVQRFTPMAIAAFGMLDSADADARYHLAMIQLHVGDTGGAEAQADTLTTVSPNHLFGYVIHAAVARWTRNEAARTRAYQTFLDRYDAEMKSGKSEYEEHRKMLEEVRRTAAGN